MGRRIPAGLAVGIDLLLAGSDAFGYLADELAADYARRYNAGDRAESLERARRLAEFAGWWCGRLEGEADHLAGFSAEPDPGVSSGLIPAGFAARNSAQRAETRWRWRRRRQP